MKISFCWLCLVQYVHWTSWQSRPRRRLFSLRWFSSFPTSFTCQSNCVQLLGFSVRQSISSSMSLVRERGVDDVLLKQQWAQTKPTTRENAPTVTEAHVPYSNGSFIDSHTEKNTKTWLQCCIQHVTYTAKLNILRWKYIRLSLIMRVNLINICLRCK